MKDRDVMILGGLGAGGGLGALHLMDSDDKPWIDLYRANERDKYGKYNPKNALIPDEDDDYLDNLTNIGIKKKKSPWR